MTEPPLPVSPSSSEITEQIAARILSEIQEQYGLDLSTDPAAMQRIREAAEKALLDLGVSNQAVINLPYISANSAGPIHFRGRLSRDELERVPETSPRGPSSESPGASESPRQKVRVQLPDRKPVVTITLMVIMGVMYLLQMLTTFFFKQDLPAALGMKINEAILAGQYWRLVTPMFLHGSLLHLGFNVYALYILGRPVERYFGRWRYLGLFVLSGITGNLFSFVFTSSPSLGSSTAIFGLLAAEGVFIYQNKKLFGDRFGTALRQIIQVAVINLLIGLSPGIDNWGHLGGLLGGIAFAWFAGPLFQLDRSAPVLELSDRRPKSRAGLVFLTELVILAGLAAWVIISRS
ncbi:MAG: rhomboid family intramembrane serine protease [Anaerolineales bacterium]